MELKVILKDLLFLVSYEFFAFYIFRPILVLIEVNLAVSWNQFHRMKFASVKRETKKKSSQFDYVIQIPTIYI